MEDKSKKDDRSLARRDDANPFSIIDRFFNDSFWDPFGPMMPMLRGRGLGAVGAAFPKVDIEETDTEIRVTANVPGMDPKHINVEVGDDYLSLSGKIEKEEKQEDKKGKVYRYEREFGEFRREFALPARVNKDGIVAKCKNGVLAITLPKSEAEKKKRVTVESE